MSARAAPIALLDWGIGGFGVVRRYRDLGGTAELVYLSDTGAPPYGRLSRAQLLPRLVSALDLLRQFEPTLIVLACNAASTLAEELRAQAAQPIESIIDHGVACVRDAGVAHAGIVGGRRTVFSQAYRSRLREHGITVRQRVAQPISGMIESGEVSGPGIADAIDAIVAPLRSCDALLLACTHYPAVIHLFSDAFGGGLVLDPSIPLSRTMLAAGNGGSTLLPMTTGDGNRMRAAARQAWGMEIGRVERVFLTA